MLADDVTVDVMGSCFTGFFARHPDGKKDVRLKKLKGIGYNSKLQSKLIVPATIHVLYLVILGLARLKLQVGLYGVQEVVGDLVIVVYFPMLQ
jgi:hypothetical protein